MRFAVLDLKTANTRMDSVCQIGFVVFNHGQVVASDVALINPRQHFDAFQSSVHEIDEETVADAPVFSDVHAQIARALRDEVVVCQTNFDRLALGRTCHREGLEPIACRWLDSARVARWAWPHLSQAGFGPARLARELGIEVQTGALAEARAAGLVLLKAFDQLGIDVEKWFEKGEYGLDGEPGSANSVQREGLGDFPLFGESIVFSGVLPLHRSEAGYLAQLAGSAVEPTITGRTTMLVIGSGDLHQASGEQGEVEELIRAGQAIRMVTGPDFLAIASRSEAQVISAQTLDRATLPEA